MAPSAEDFLELPISAIAKRLEIDHKIATAYLLGSAAEGRLRADSDVDIAVLPVRGARFLAQERMDLASDLTAVARRSVDLGI